MLNIKVSIHIALTCLAALLYASIASAQCVQNTNLYGPPPCSTDDCAQCEQETMDSTLPPCRPVASAPCYVVGSNGEFCASDPAQHLAGDEWLAEDQCYVDYGICERDQNGQCGWRNTNELSQCIDNMRRGIDESIQPCIPCQNTSNSGCR